MYDYVGRLAPAPTGALHLGNARTFLIAWLRSRQNNGKLILRIEDLDHPKIKPETIQQVYDDLEWLGLSWDEGPFLQSTRIKDIYAPYLNYLCDKKLIYPCTCTRKDIESFRSAPNDGEDLRELRYSGHCRDLWTDLDAARLSTGREPSMRFRITDNTTTSFDDASYGYQQSILSDWSGDFIVSRGNSPGYQLAVVIDDHLMGITEVVRGSDLLASTHRQLLLYKAFGWKPPKYFHVPVVVGPDGRRLAKRHGDTRIKTLRQTDCDPKRVLGWMAWSCGWIKYPQSMSLSQILSLATFGAKDTPYKITLTNKDLHWIGFPAPADGRPGSCF